MHDIVKPPLQQTHQGITGIPLRLLRVAEITAELALQHSITVFDFLLLTEMNTIVGWLATSSDMLPWRCLAPLKGALGSITTVTLEEQFHPVATTKTTDGTGVTCHISEYQISS